MLFRSVGCGYGPIGIYFSCTYPEITVDMVDINKRAVELARENAKNNQAGAVTVYESDLLSAVASMRYDVVVSNPPIRTGKDNVFQLYEEAHRVLNDNGALWIVIQKKQGAPSSIKKLEMLFTDVDVIAKKKGYFIICAKK